MLIAEHAATATPKAPKTLQEAGLGRDLVTQLILKTLHLSGELTGTELARRIGLPFFTFEPVLADIKHKQRRLLYVGRPAAASPATGLLRRHNREQAYLVDEALDLSKH